MLKFCFVDGSLARINKNTNAGSSLAANENIICRCRLAVWRQLPKLISAGPTPVTCSTSINGQSKVRLFLISTQYKLPLYIEKLKNMCYHKYIIFIYI